MGGEKTVRDLKTPRPKKRRPPTTLRTRPKRLFGKTVVEMALSLPDLG